MMDQMFFDMFEAILFFVLLGITFQAMMRLDITKYFQKGAVWQMQIIYIFLSIGLSFLVLQAVMNLINITRRLFT